MTRPENGIMLMKWIKPTELVEVSENTAFPIGNAFELDPTYLYKSSSTSVTINMKFKDPVIVQGFALINHNLTENAVIKIRFCTDNTYQNYSEESIDYYLKNTYTVTSTSTAHQYIQLFISNSKPIEIGCIYPARIAFQLIHNYSIEHDFSFRVEKTIDVTDYGLQIEYPNPDNGDIPPPECHSYKISFDNIDQQYFESYCDLIRPGSKVWVPKGTEKKCYFGIVSDNELFNKRKRTGDSFSITFQEHSLEGII